MWNVWVARVSKIRGNCTGNNEDNPQLNGIKREKIEQVD